MQLCKKELETLDIETVELRVKLSNVEEIVQENGQVKLCECGVFVKAYKNLAFGRIKGYLMFLSYI